MRIELQRAIQMRLADEVAEIVIASLILRIERQVIDLATLFIARHAQQSADNWLHTFVKTRFGEHDCAVEAIAISQRNCGKAALFGELCHTLGLNRPLKQRVRRQNAKRDKGRKRHAR